MKKIKINVEGMTCEHCVTSLNKAVNKVKGVIKVDTSLAKKESLILAADDIKVEDIKKSIENAGYKPLSHETAEVSETELEKSRTETGNTAEKNHNYDYDLIVIGGGSAAFSAAIKFADEGKKVCVVENWVIGGTCLNRGCVPSKHLLEAARIYYEPLSNKFKGIETKQTRIDLKEIIKVKTELLDSLREMKYYNVLRGYGNITFIEGRGSFASKNSVKVVPNDKNKESFNITSEKFIIATGSKNQIINIEGLEEAGYITNEEILKLDYLPETLLILGTRAVSLEFAQMFRRFGSKVVVIGRSDRILLNEEPEISESLIEILKNEGIEFLLNSKISRLYKDDGKKLAEIKTEAGIKTINFDEFLMATGVTGNTDGLNLNAVGVETDEYGFVKVNDELQTANPDIYACGDVTGLTRLVTTAAYDGKIASDNMLHVKHLKVDYSAVAHTIFTDPEVSSVGLTEESAVKAGYDIIKTVFPVEYVPKARSIFKTDGVIKMIADKKTGRVLGIHMVAHNSSETIQQASVYLQNGYTIQQIGEEIGVYPTMAEGLKLAAQTFTKDVSKLSCCA
jgi:mercuric reductase